MNGQGLELFKDVPNVRVLVCGGDGTVGWVLEAMDQVGMSAPVGTLPLGTGNDLAREFNWGGGYAGLPVLKALQHLARASPEKMDRWHGRYFWFLWGIHCKTLLLLNFAVALSFFLSLFLSL